MECGIIQKMTEVEGEEAGWLQCIANRVVREKVIGWEMTHRGHESRRDISIMKTKKRRSKKRNSLILKTLGSSGNVMN